MPPRRHIQFAAGELEDELLRRTGESERPDWTAHRDLARYYHALAAELARVRLSPDEATVVVAAARGWLVTPETAGYLWAEVEDYLRDQVEDAGIAALDTIPRLDTATRATLVARLRSLSPAASLAVCDAAERYWHRVSEAAPRAALSLPDDNHAAMLRAVGLVRDDA